MSLSFRSTWIPLLCLSVLLSSCTLGDSDEAAVVETRGDTTVMLVPDTAGARPTQPPRVLLRDPRIQEPRGLGQLSDGTFVIGDRYQVHFAAPEGHLIRSVGRRGEGPGEFGSIAAVGIKNDTIYVLDSRIRRLTLLSRDGEVLRTKSGFWVSELPNLGRGPGRLGTWERGVMVVARSLPKIDEPSEQGVVRMALDTDSVEVPVRIDDWVRTEASNGVLAIKNLYGHRALLDVGDGGMMAWGNGVDPCLQLKVVGSKEVRRFCVDRTPLPLEAAVRDPDLCDLEESRRRMMGPLIEVQEFPDVLPHYDRIEFVGRGEVWMRRMDERHSMKHIRMLVNADTAARVWDVYDVETGPSATISLPARFRPMVGQAHRVVGFLTLDTGEIALAEVQYRD